MRTRSSHRASPVGRSLVALLAIPVLALVSGPGTAAAAAAAPMAVQPAGPTSAFVALTPCRLADTRDGSGFTRLDVASIRVAARGRCGVPDDATALAVTVSVTETVAGGFLTAHPAGSARPTTSSLNWSPGEIRGNGALLALSADGALDLYASTPAAVVLDVNGAFVPATSATAGRFVPVTPARLLDTRETAGPLAAGATVTVPRPADVPADATALAVTVTAVEPAAAGFVTAYPSGHARPNAAILNVDRAGQVRAAGQIVAISPEGFTLFAQSRGHLVVDVTGWFTGPNAADGTDGLFVPAPPTRLLDTRETSAVVYPGGTWTLPTADATGPGAAAIAVNWAITGTGRAGFVTAYPAGTPQPTTSTINADRAQQTVANLGIVPVSTLGVSAFSSSGTHLVADLTGWFTGAPADPNVPVAPNDRPAPLGRVLLMGDSTMAGIRWYTNSQQALRGTTFVLDVESCRRLIATSCTGREGRRPPTAYQAILAAPGSYDAVVVMTGYNDWYNDFPQAVDLVVSAARAKGARSVIWLTYRRNVAYLTPWSRAAADVAYRINNATLYAKQASGAFPDLVIADWDAYTRASADWFTADGVHFRLSGAYGAADYASRYVAHAGFQPCPMPWTVGGAIDPVCPNPDLHAPAPPVIDLYAANPNDIHCYEVGADRHLECRPDNHL